MATQGSRKVKIEEQHSANKGAIKIDSSYLSRPAKRIIEEYIRFCNIEENADLHAIPPLQLRHRIVEIKKALQYRPPQAGRFLLLVPPLDSFKSAFSEVSPDDLGLQSDFFDPPNEDFLSATQFDLLSRFRDAPPEIRQDIFFRVLRSRPQDLDLTISNLLNEFLGRFVENDSVNIDGDDTSDNRPSISEPFHEVRVAERPRWAEENRPGKRLSMRLSVDLLNTIDEVASHQNATRTDWITNVARHGLAQYARTAPPDVPDFKTTRPVHIRLPEELYDAIDEAAIRANLTKTEWVRRIARAEINALNTRHSPEP